MILWKIALRNVFRHRTRSLITLSAIVFGCVAIILVGGFFEHLFFSMREGYINDSSGHLQVYREGFSEKGRKEPFKYLIDDPAGLTERLNRIPEVASVQPLLMFAGLLSSGDTTTSFYGQGIRAETLKYLRITDLQNDVRGFYKTFIEAHEDKNKNGKTVAVFLDEGEGLAPKDTLSGMLGRGLAHALDVKVGDTLVAVANSAHGYINAVDVTVKGITSSSQKAVDDVLLQLPLATAQNLLQTDSVQTLVVRLKKTEDTDKVARQIMDELPREGYAVELKTWVELNDFYVKTVLLFNRFFLVVKAIIAIIVILSIFNTMNMAVLERTNEIGTLMALGTKPGEVMRLFLLEGFLLGALGGLLGLLIGGAVTAAVSAVGIPMPPPPGSYQIWLSKPMLVPSAFVYAYGLSLATALISSAYPAFTASRLEVAVALRKVG